MKFSFARLRRSRIALAIVGAMLVALAVLALGKRTVEAPVVFKDIPLPFASSSADVRGALSPMGERNGIPVMEVTFAGDERERLVPDTIYLVHVPNAAHVNDVPMDLAFSTAENADDHNVDYYLYKYSDASASSERRDIAAVRFADRFPGRFAASLAARVADSDHGHALSLFEAERDVIFHRTDNTDGGVRLDPSGSLYAVIVNHPGGANMRVAGITGCGNGITEPPEFCDDGNSVDTDECSNACASTIPIPFDGSSSSSSDSSSSDASSSDSSTSESSSSDSSSSDGSDDSSSSSSDSSSSDSSSSDSSSSSSGGSSAVCGDGIVTREAMGGEQCDDGAAEPGDGCSAVCRAEDGYTCRPQNVCLTDDAYVLSLGDTDSDGTLSDTEALVLILDVADAHLRSYGDVYQYNMNSDDIVSQVDQVRIYNAIDRLAP